MRLPLSVAALGAHIVGEPLRAGQFGLCREYLIIRNYLTLAHVHAAIHVQRLSGDIARFA